MHGRTLRWRRPVENRLRHSKVGVQIDLRRLIDPCPSQSAIIDCSTPSCSKSIAVVWRSTWGLTRLFFSDGHCAVAIATYLLSR